ncbi:MAG: right-handed parallel beta-helix repeat-containing protein, partial [Verrucomicrobiales bacterium]|nr:right-handed parallel beta-helix repeat-containing protein [Verrucomicrobiales bacterium]
DNSSSDISFDLELNADSLSSNPGDFTLNADVTGRQLSHPVVSLGETLPAPISGTLTGASTTWSGIVLLDGDVTVPAGHTLTVSPGTIVLLDGDATPGSSAGIDIIVEGTLLSQGTRARPVTFTASQDGDSWGQLLFDEASPSTFHFTHIHRAGHAPGGGHTGRGRSIYIRGSDVTFDDSSISDNFGKIGQCNASGGNNSLLTIRRSHLARSATGFETTDTGVLIEDTHMTEFLGVYREDGIIDDNDAIYIHRQAAGQTLVLRDVVVAVTEDDGIDTLDGQDVVLDNVISRDCLDKGISLLGGSATITRAILASNDIGMSAKAGCEVTLDHVTVTGNSSTGIQNENKTGSDAPSFYTVTNSIILGADAVTTDYDETGMTFNFCILGEPWAHAGSDNNSQADPLFVSTAANDFHLTAASTAIDSGDPGAPLDPDSSPTDIGRFTYDPAFDNTAAGGEVVWSPASGPYHVIDDVTIPAGLKLIIQPGTAIYLDGGKRISVEGTIHAVGTETDRIQVNALPGAPFEPDTAGNDSLPDGPPKSDGIKIVNSASPDNIISYLDIGNAQDSNGSIGIIDSECIIDHVTFRASHIRMLYIEDSSVIVQYCSFPDMFAPGESPDALGLDNISEHIKGVGQAPGGGHYILRYNSFGTNKGHNDVIDVESPNLPDPIAQIIGNTFAGAGDELLDLGGDVYVAENFFYNVNKDDETSDRGYANAISTGDSGSQTTIAVARNIFWDVDHAINLKRDTTTIFENNTIYKIHPDFDDRFDNPSVSSVINLFIPTDSSPTAGDGAFASGNIFTDLTRIYSGADAPGDRVSPLEFTHNLVDPALPDTSISPDRPGETIFDLGNGNINALPQFLDPDNGDFSLAPGSPAIGTGPLGRDFGALTPPGIWISGEPPAVTSSNSATLTVGAPGIFAYRWRLDGGPWSADTDIGDGFDPPAPTTRSSTISLTALADGPHTVEVEGMNFAGAWQETPSVSKTWNVNSALPASVRLNEILATGTPDTVELFNPGPLPYDLS